MRLRATALAVLALVTVAHAATPDAAPDLSVPTIRVTTAEVHLTFTATGERDRPVTSLTASDFVLLRDDSPITPIVSLATYHQSPLSLLILTDVSDSMTQALPLQRTAADWMKANSDASRDRIQLLDFGDRIQSAGSGEVGNRHLTSLFDSLMATLPHVPSADNGRRALLVLTDGFDNDSYHSLRDVIQLAQRQDVAIYAITAHPGKKQSYDPRVLRWICEQTGGRFYDVKKTDAMLSAVAAVNDELRNGYELIFRPGAASAGMHRLSLQPVDQRLRFYYRAAYFQPYAAHDVAAR